MTDETDDTPPSLDQFSDSFPVEVMAPVRALVAALDRQTPPGADRDEAHRALLETLALFYFAEADPEPEPELPRVDDPKDSWIAHADALGIDSTGTKSEIIERVTSGK